MEFRLKKKDKTSLEKIVESQTASKREKNRARILLMANDGNTQAKISSELGITVPTIRKWLNKYTEEGLGDLTDAPRTGRPIIYTKEIKDTIIKKLKEEPPVGPYWSGTMLAEELGIPLYAVMNILHKENISLVKLRREKQAEK